MKWILSVLVALLVSFRARGGEAEWIVYIEDGGSAARAVELLPADTPLANYTENLTLISPEMMREKIEFPEDRPHQPQIRTVTHPYEPDSQSVAKLGNWHGYTVYDVKNIDVRHRSIVLADEKGNHRILYTQACWSTMTMDSIPEFVTVQGNTILAYRCHKGGTGNFHIEYYFIFDPETRLPVPLSLDPIETKLKEILPENRAVWKGGGFDIATLSYKHSVWQKGDHNCCPSAGQVRMKLEIRDNTLVVVESNYDPKALRD